MEDIKRDTLEELKKRRLEEIQLQNEINSQEAMLTRARSVTVGTCFGGTTELMMRNDSGFMWCPMQPVEVIELIHQLAANVGCHIALKPRDDFSSWREWRVSEAEKKHLNGHPPFVNDMAVFQRLGASGFNQEQAEQIINNWLDNVEYEYINGGATEKKKRKQIKGQSDETVATKKPTNKRISKSASDSS